MEKRYKIFISAQPRSIVYTVSKYNRITTERTDDIEFIDEVTGEPIKTAWTNCIVKEVQ